MVPMKIKDSSLKNEIPDLYRRIHKKLLERARVFYNRPFISSHEFRYVAGSTGYITKWDYLTVAREMESFGLLELNLRNKKNRIRVVNL